MLPPLKKWLRKQPYQQVRPDKEAVHCHTFEKMAAQTALSAGGVCRSASPRACRLRGLPPPGRGICRSASPPCLPFARPPPTRERHLPLRIPPCLPFARLPSPGRGICRSASLPCLPFARPPPTRERCMVWEHARSACSHTIHLSGERRRREHAREAEIRRLLSLTDKQRVYEIRYKSAIYSWNPYD